MIKLKLATSVKIIKDIQNKFSFYKLQSEDLIYSQNEELEFYKGIHILTNSIPALVEDAETSTSDLLQYYAHMSDKHIN